MNQNKDIESIATENDAKNIYIKQIQNRIGSKMLTRRGSLWLRKLR